MSEYGYLVLKRLLRRDKCLTQAIPVFLVGYVQLCLWSSLKLSWINADLYVYFGLN